MRRKLSLSLALCLLSLLFAAASEAGNGWRVDENSTRLFLRERAAEVSLAVENQSDEQTANVRLELVAPDDAVKFSAARETVLRRGRNEISLAFENFAAPDDLIFYRLRAQISSPSQTIQSVVAVSAIAPEIFEIEVAATEILRENQTFVARVRAAAPVLGAGVADVRLSGEMRLEFENGRTPLVLKAAAVTDADGGAVLKFDLPPALSAAAVDDARLIVVGEKNNLRRTAENSGFDFDDQPLAFVQTDKPLYQPGERLRVRLLYLSAGRRAVPNADLTFVVRDPENQILQRIAARTSRFGVAHAEWQIADNARLGDYSIRFENAEGEAFRTVEFKVTRYELPNFAVRAKTDKNFYLPADRAAEIEIAADYLFGQPVTRARVRVVREMTREWNYKTQKYESEESEEQTGELGANGKFTARFDLTKEHADLADDDDDKFADLRFAAYVTDLTTNKTERRRFDVRLSKEPIHVRLINAIGNQSRRLPARFYVSAFYADGAPAACDVQLHRRRDADDDDKIRRGKLLAETRTNRLGAGKLDLPLEFLPADEDEIEYVLTARDERGGAGTETDEIDVEDEPGIRLETDKTIYRTGESVRVSIAASDRNGALLLDVLSNGQIVETQTARLLNGRAEIVLPFRAEFRDAVTIAAYRRGANANGEDADEVFIGRKTVIFPRRRDLNVAANLTKNVFRPGEAASVELTAAAPDGAPVETAFGVVVLDKAIEERARTDAENAGDYRAFNGDFGSILGFKRGFGGLSAAEINNLDLSKQISPDYELAVELALQTGNQYQPEFFESRDFQNALDIAFAPYFKRQFDSIKNALDALYQGTGESPADDADLRRILTARGIDFDALRDPWGNQYRTTFFVSQDKRHLKIRSGGADKQFDTADDF